MSELARYTATTSSTAAELLRASTSTLLRLLLTILSILAYLPSGISLDSRILRIPDPLLERKNLIGREESFLNRALIYYATIIITRLSILTILTRLTYLHMGFSGCVSYLLY